MALDIEAVYEDGVLKPRSPLPLDEHECVTVRLERHSESVERSAGIVSLPKQTETIDHLLGPENSLWEN